MIVFDLNIDYTTSINFLKKQQISNEKTNFIKSVL